MTQPWYRQFWPWFIIALPCAAVVGSIATAIIASKDGVNLVAEDYYKQGKEINQISASSIAPRRSASVSPSMSATRS